VRVHACAGRHGEQQGFYQQLYSVMEEPGEVLRQLVRQKEAFAAHACRLAVQDALG
jgi:hypothetical protein